MVIGVRRVVFESVIEFRDRTEPAAWHSQGQDSQKGLGTSENGEKNTLEICAIATTSRRE
ncbi:hypothetical protein HBI14_081950 [Parastagonospora nodorum]|nr:hypothetical protein HBI14_081950 [Parastagonospora nodorum]